MAQDTSPEAVAEIVSATRLAANQVGALSMQGEDYIWRPASAAEKACNRAADMIGALYAALTSERTARETAERVGHERCDALGDEIIALRADLEAMDGELTEYRKVVEAAALALAPFADIGQWLFARDLPDETPLVDVTGLNGLRGALTRGHFKAAHTALSALSPRTQTVEE